MNDMDGVVYSIAEASERLGGLSYRTLHYYEDKIGLIVNRDSAGNRVYTERDLELFDKIIELKKRGMTLDGIKTFLQERGLVPLENETNILVIDENTMEIKELLIDEIKMAVAEQVRQELKSTNAKLEEVLNDNMILKEGIHIILKQSDDHFSKFDRQLTNWREASDRPWYKNIFKKKGDKKGEQKPD